ncbi:hypothetical protein IF1G_02895 [Cordyceps javanica]|uniref:Uncharacterized protein n=1 Tax=Cordyceps javanica TaxID=43265 RepID=A0A545VAR2_9HYPO|nr:hypothetical protein IF1G_02895 [Cordyceps javanica]
MAPRFCQSLSRKMRGMQVGVVELVLDAATAAVHAHVAVGGLELLLGNLVGAVGVGLVSEGGGGDGRGEEAESKEASVATAGANGGRGKLVSKLENLELDLRRGVGFFGRVRTENNL